MGTAAVCLFCLIRDTPPWPGSSAGSVRISLDRCASMAAILRTTSSRWLRSSNGVERSTLLRRCDSIRYSTVVWALWAFCTCSHRAALLVSSHPNCARTSLGLSGAKVIFAFRAGSPLVSISLIVPVPVSTETSARTPWGSLPSRVTNLATMTPSSLASCILSISSLVLLGYTYTIGSRLG